MKWFNLFSFALDFLIAFRQWKKDHSGFGSAPDQIKH